MTLFPPPVESPDERPDGDLPYRADEPARPRSSRRARTGWTMLLVALVLGLVMSFLPAPYAIEQPGPVYDTLGTQEQDGEDVPLISIDGAETYPTAGTLDMLTVSVRGTREQRPSWAEIFSAWFDTSKAVVPIDLIYPPTVSTEQRNEQNAALMVDSQTEAIAAALGQLGIDYTREVTVAGVTEDGAAAGVLGTGDVIESVNGVPVDDIEELKAELAANGTESPATLVVRSADDPETGEPSDDARSVEVTPRLAPGSTDPVIGIGVSYGYEFPFDVVIQLDDVGGPSAGMMFALGIIDKLTPGELNGGENIAGTGTIDDAGTVGPIGGIRQKLFGARDAGADWFLAPATNCGEVVGHVPDGIRVFAVATLDEAMTAVETIADGGDTSALPTCEAVLAGS
ncbi:PDZ domain-containing protein [Herbiconiux sp. CPCC 203407]|uniref:endopeptidase La n=2 Tax=Herbiconiux oxytropis TaxID=2970915 RepID=A0AA42BTY6_9MICO|nr:S16 family serine protease [Herbiconiux oxytropis]MCS5721239.1 PDZ domain-containing protein [Herbiconiux oxytropis]MCS5726322.1 PDZ domain-containing protein [Herbiconiux oxytropis]